MIPAPPKLPTPHFPRAVSQYRPDSLHDFILLQLDTRFEIKTYAHRHSSEKEQNHVPACTKDEAEKSRAHRQRYMSVGLARSDVST